MSAGCMRGRMRRLLALIQHASPLAFSAHLYDLVAAAGVRGERGERGGGGAVEQTNCLGARQEGGTAQRRAAAAGLCFATPRKKFE
jgi:hypothetical protein